MNTRHTLSSLVSVLALGWMSAGAVACVDGVEGDDVFTEQEAIEGGVVEPAYCEAGARMACGSSSDAHRICVGEGDDAGWTACTDEPEDGCTVGVIRTCVDGNALQVCEATDAGSDWSVCEDSYAYCAEEFNFTPNPDAAVESVPEWDSTAGTCRWSNTPLVLSFDSAPVQFTSKPGATFDLTGKNMSHQSDWVTAATPWLALDRNGNGMIDSGRELFGSAVRLTTGNHASNGFVALAELDDNADGVIDEHDLAFGELLVWGDKDLDRRSDRSEVVSAKEAGLVSISLNYKVSARCDARHNCERERASFNYKASSGSVMTGSVVDVYLR